MTREIPFARWVCVGCGAAVTIPLGKLPPMEVHMRDFSSYNGECDKIEWLKEKEKP